MEINSLAHTFLSSLVSLGNNNLQEILLIYSNNLFKIDRSLEDLQLPYNVLSEWVPGHLDVSVGLFVIT